VAHLLATNFTKTIAAIWMSRAAPVEFQRTHRKAIGPRFRGSVIRPHGGVHRGQYLNAEGQHDHELIFLGEGSPAVRAETKRVARGLFILASASATLNLRLVVPFIFDDPSGLVIGWRIPVRRLGTPGAEPVTLVFPFGERQQAAVAKENVLLGTPEIQKHFSPEPQEDAPHFSSGILHNASRLAILSPVSRERHKQSQSASDALTLTTLCVFAS